MIYDQNTGKHMCCKLVPGLKDEIDTRIDEYIARAKKNGQDIANMGRPVGDNCPGYLYLKNAPQGCDIPGSA
jgi:hypothetical protein